MHISWRVICWFNFRNQKKNWQHFSIRRTPQRGYINSKQHNVLWLLTELSVTTNKFLLETKLESYLSNTLVTLQQSNALWQRSSQQRPKWILIWPMKMKKPSCPKIPEKTLEAITPPKNIANSDRKKSRQDEELDSIHEKMGSSNHSIGLLNTALRWDFEM